MVEIKNSATRLLIAHREGDTGAFEQLVELLYHRLHELAHRELLRGRPGQLQTTALVNELYLKLVDQRGGWQDRGHFFAACTKAMRRIVIDEARRQVSLKRGGGMPPVPMNEKHDVAEDEPEWLLLIDQLMDRLATHDARAVQVFECRYFGGYTVEETAEALGLSTRTIERDWARAGAWLREAMG